jgi:uncharacterized membrane protein YfcA
LTDFLLILAGGFAGGFVSGLTGFGNGLTALAFWLYVVPPVIAAPLVALCSIIGQIQTLPAIWHAMDFRRVLPFVAGGLIGVPAGTFLLAFVSAQTFKISVGIFLICYCAFMLAGKIRVEVTWGGRIADAVIGLGGGVLGGLAGLSGPLPTLWAGLRGWGKDARRAVFQAFNFSILGFAFLTQLAAGIVTFDLAHYALIAIPGTVSGVWLGRNAYARLGETGFDRVVLIVLMASGAALIVNALS